MDKKTKPSSEVEIQTTGEDNIDEPQIVDEEATQTDKIKNLKAKLKECEVKRGEQLNELQRAKADFLNARKRLEEQLQTDKAKALNSFLLSLLPLCDSFDMAMSDQAAWQSTPESWRQGVEGIKTQLDNILKAHNVVEINATGEKFDPERHEAMSVNETGTGEETVAEVLQKGYARNGEILRVAKVIIEN